VYLYVFVPVVLYGLWCLPTSLLRNRYRGFPPHPPPPPKVKRPGHEGDNFAPPSIRLRRGRPTTLLPLYDKNTFLSNSARLPSHHCFWKVLRLRPFFLVQMNVSMEYWWNDTESGKPKYWGEKNLFHKSHTE
jgi:hypothetical protein